MLLPLPPLKIYNTNWGLGSVQLFSGK
uniref:Uncharacterized protein n=1 Tax=Medicago truncatula TaxID=3880 RepID=I3SIP8_MEDTR|nr:unknown [Medicago truncatula]